MCHSFLHSFIPLKFSSTVLYNSVRHSPACRNASSYKLGRLKLLCLLLTDYVMGETTALLKDPTFSTFWTSCLVLLQTNRHNLFYLLLHCSIQFCRADYVQRRACSYLCLIQNFVIKFLFKRLQHYWELSYLFLVFLVCKSFVNLGNLSSSEFK